MSALENQLNSLMMPQPSQIIRDAAETDLAAIEDIYAYYVLNGLASFEITPPDQTEIARRWQAIQQDGFPYLVAELDGQIGGFTYAASYRPRPAYNHTVEDSVYVSPDCLGQGIGQTLLTATIENCTALGLRQMIAVIGDSNNHPSINLHKKCGFSQVGVMTSTGYKLEQWVDSVIMQRALGEGDTSPPTPR